MAKRRIRPNILITEAACDCVCGLMPSEKHLDRTQHVIGQYGKGIPISTMARCNTYNKDIGGVDDSPHKLSEQFDQSVPDKDRGYGATDYTCRDGHSRANLMNILYPMFLAGIINHLEICDRHVHAAKVPDNHRLAGQVNWGKSK